MSDIIKAPPHVAASGKYTKTMNLYTWYEQRMKYDRNFRLLIGGQMNEQTDRQTD